MSTPQSNDRDDLPFDDDAEKDDTASTPGSGKQFEQDVHSPAGTTTTHGSGKQFSGSDEPDDADDDSGSGKQFAPGHHDQ